MESNNPNVVDGQTPKRKNKPKTVWDHRTLKVYLDLCLTEVRKGNKPGTHFNKVGWTNLEKNMREKTGKVFERKQLKNKWDLMKKDWKLYDRFTKLEPQINRTEKTLDMSPEWWDEKIKVDKDFAKFRDSNLEIYDMYYAPLFGDSVAIGDRAMTPYQIQNDSNPDDVQRVENMEGKGDCDEMNIGDNEPLFPSLSQTSCSKRKKQMDVVNSRSTRGRIASFEEKLDVVLEALLSRSTQTTLHDCMSIVTSFPGFEEGTRMYFQALLVLVKKKNREAFMYPTTHEAKMAFLKYVMEK